jgi:hypothetical protein
LAFICLQEKSIQLILMSVNGGQQNVRQTAGQNREEILPIWAFLYAPNTPPAAESISFGWTMKIGRRNPKE